MTTLNTSLLKGFGAALLAGTAMSNFRPGDFVSHLKPSSNIWLMGAQDGDHTAEFKILGWTVFYLFLHNACKAITSTLPQVHIICPFYVELDQDLILILTLILTLILSARHSVLQEKVSKVF